MGLQRMSFQRTPDADSDLYYRIISCPIFEPHHEKGYPVGVYSLVRDPAGPQKDSHKIGKRVLKQLEKPPQENEALPLVIPEEKTQEDGTFTFMLPNKREPQGERNESEFLLCDPVQLALDIRDVVKMYLGWHETPQTLMKYVVEMAKDDILTPLLQYLPEDEAQEEWLRIEKKIKAGRHKNCSEKMCKWTGEKKERKRRNELLTRPLMDVFTRCTVGFDGDTQRKYYIAFLLTHLGIIKGEVYKAYNTIKKEISEFGKNGVKK